MAERVLDVWRIGRIDYDDALELQRALVAARTAGAIEDTLLLLEHPPTITLGRGAKEEHLLLDRDALEAQGVHVRDIGRGGDVTYHGPGQLVGYPIIDLKPDRRDVRKYVASLEETMIRVAADHGVVAERLEGFNGTWIEPHGFRPRKIGAVGVRISRWVTMHGFAFNIDPNMGHFGLIVPCGIQGKGVASLAGELDASPEWRAVETAAGEHFAEIQESQIRWHDGRPEVPVVS
ncbi:MAG: lipoyl(octanoyl) transferase LipB [Deltaproteobacteria bacterium]|nr:lipoyl(octanoyl) transferase LipB [Deltaproteobacteria bacterium]